MLGDISVSVAVTLRYGCPIAAYIFENDQSEIQCAHGMSSRYLADTWDDLGIISFQFVIKCTFGSFMAAQLFTRRQILSNALAAHHVLLMFLRAAKRNYGAAYERFFLPLRTTINSCYANIHAALRALFAPGDVPFCMEKTGENSNAAHSITAPLRGSVP